MTTDTNATPVDGDEAAKPAEDGMAPVGGEMPMAEEKKDEEEKDEEVVA